MMNIANNKLMVSVYQDFKNNLREKNLLEILEDIKSDKYKSEINSIRYAKHKGDEALVSTFKSKLIGFTTSGTFGASRTKTNITTYSQIVCLDFDDVPQNELQDFAAKINETQYTFASFISPSGEGLKVFVQVSTNAEQHTNTYKQIANFYKEVSGYNFDAKCKDITRLCFVSYDEDLYLNKKAIIFEIQEEVKPTTTKVENKVTLNLSTEELLDKCVKFTEKKEQYQNGNRNNFIHLFASNSNRFGIYEADTLDYCITNFDLDEKEIKATISSTYKNQFADFAKFAKFANLQTTEVVKKNAPNKTVIIDEEDYLKTTPIIPQSVYDNLPPILFEACKVFTEFRSRDTFLTGALAIISGCLPNVSGLYSGSVVFPSLFSFILAPAASGKGALKFAKALADKYHNVTLAESLDDKKRYEENLSAYKMLKGKGKVEPNQEMPMPPKFKVVFIPANTSNAKIMQHLDWNDGSGIICETEADTLGQTFKNDWGSYSDMLRKSFHHERISKSIKTEGEYLEIENPQLSVALSGTPKQVFNIIASAEDGLFSRFIFYVFKTEAVWLDPSPKGNPVNLTDYFNKQSLKVFKMVEFFERDSMTLQLTDEQWDKFNPTFSAYLEQISTFVSDDAQSIVKRLGIILYRICMIFTAIRKFDTNDYHKEIYCSDTDFETALALIQTYIQHSIIMFENLPQQGEQGPFKSGENKKKFFDVLPNKFQRKEAIELAEQFKIKERTTDNFLKSCLGKYLVKSDTGLYKKIE